MHEGQPTRPPAADTTWCHWHKGDTTTGVFIDVIEQASGPGAALYACEACRQRLRLKPA
ncbi:hypothetical protein [Streptomyces sp. TS71-3]|uniref:hypothetical protein n=1 Tax=Streptomyces sp. TS71-3 TaxID=2733862 RepID=UPI001B0DE669|nr:hypothetical protein [Streptomyces sp. TS71-3]GHJ36828.1 hypothetical protein Sm713_24370 [Streptomyces sp. TS71-3]